MPFGAARHPPPAAAHPAPRPSPDRRAHPPIRHGRAFGRKIFSGLYDFSGTTQAQGAPGRGPDIRRTTDNGGPSPARAATGAFHLTSTRRHIIVPANLLFKIV